MSPDMSLRGFIIYCIAISFVFFVVSQGVYLKNADEARNKIEGLQEELDKSEEQVERLSGELSEHQESLGGLEERVTETVHESGIIFPIHEDDFLRYTSPFGRRKSPFLNFDVNHRGLDIATVWRAQVRSVADGRVVEHWPPPGTHQGDTEFEGHEVYGGMIKIDHGDFTSLYAHLDTTDVRTGQRVNSGDYIGRVGDSGLSRGYHLHIEIEVDGEVVNPLLYLDELTSFGEDERWE